MIKRGGSSAQKRHRLPEQARIPTEEDIGYLYSEASKHPGQLVELPWSVNRQPYVLTAKHDRRNNEHAHQWSFYRGDGPHSKLEWNYESSDTFMIYNLILTAFPEDRIKPDPALLETLQLKPGDPQPAMTDQPAQRPVMGVLEGNLAEMPLPSLLNSIQSSHLTGRLSVQSPNSSISSDLYFDDGNLVEAKRQNLEGEDAFLEVALNSAVGDFKFFDNDVARTRSIQIRLDALLLQAAALTDQTRFLDKQGLRPESCLLRANPNITEREFEEKLANLAPVDMGLQKRFYQAVDGKASFGEILAQSNLPRQAWTPLIFNLLSAGLLRTETKAVAAQAEPASQNPVIDLKALEKFTASMTRKDSGIYTEIAFLFFLEHEYYRYHSYGTPFTLMLFRLAPLGVVIADESLKAALEVVKSTVRTADILGHYDGNDYALILPHTSPQAATGLSSRLNSILNQPPFVDIALAIGVAGMPEDCQDLISLLTLARQRKQLST